MNKRGLLERLEEEIIVGDGAMGTQIYAKGIPIHRSFDELNLTTPHLVRVIHKEYIDAGAQLIETNTFTANRMRLRRFGLQDKVAEINRRGAEIAREVAGDDVIVAGSVGPIGNKTEEGEEIAAQEKEEIFREQIEALRDGGCDVIILETFLDLDEIIGALKIVKAKTNLPAICQLTFSENLKTYSGVSGVKAIRELEKAGADVVGANCGRGPSEALKVIEKMASVGNVKLSVFPNAGLPEYVNGRYMYLSTPEYFSAMAKKMANAGANIIGGCCGTTPDDIRAIAQKLRGTRPIPRRLIAVAEVKEVKPKAAKSRKITFLDKLKTGVVTVVELDPPRGMDCEKIIGGAKRLAQGGVDAITVGDNPLAVVRMGNVGVAHLIEREGIQTIAHMSCRDRNLIGLQSSIMEASALGITSLLAITGDPAKVGDQPGATSVYDLNSFELIKLIDDMNAGKNYGGNSIKSPTQFVIGCAYNPNVKDWTHQIRRIEKKIKAGAHYALTQPLYDVRRIGPMYDELRRSVGDFPVFLGVLPLVSAKNAEYLHYEVPGISLPEDVLQRMRDVPEERAKEEGMAIAKELIDEALRYTNGIYIIPPFGNVAVAEEIARHTKAKSSRHPAKEAKR